METPFYKCPQGPQIRKHGAGRVTAFFLTLAVINVLLGVYTLYMLGFALSYDWTQLKTGSAQAILEAALQLLLPPRPASSDRPP